ncbi:MAG TPA: hypothetical protein VFE46_12680 [Pirellulales bacterium]|jgi:hypothetical protein|nr:hypothetical protein [Pirellulales bacterium]
MNTPAESFRYKQEAFDADVRALAQSDSIGDLDTELATAKLLLRDVVDSAQTPAERQRAAPLCRDLLKCIATISAAHLDHQLKNRELIHRRQLEKFTNNLTELICRTLQDAGIKDYESLIVDPIVAGLDSCLPQHEPERKRRA